MSIESRTNQRASGSIPRVQIACQSKLCRPPWSWPKAESQDTWLEKESRSPTTTYACCQSSNTDELIEPIVSQHYNQLQIKADFEIIMIAPMLQILAGSPGASSDFARCGGQFVSAVRHLGAHG